MTVKQIVARTGNTEFATAHGLISLLRKGMIHPTDGCTVEQAIADLRQQIMTGMYN